MSRDDDWFSVDGRLAELKLPEPISTSERYGQYNNNYYHYESRWCNEISDIVTDADLVWKCLRYVTA